MQSRSTTCNWRKPEQQSTLRQSLYILYTYTYIDYSGWTNNNHSNWRWIAVWIFIGQMFAGCLPCVCCLWVISIKWNGWLNVSALWVQGEYTHTSALQQSCCSCCCLTKRAALNWVSSVAPPFTTPSLPSLLTPSSALLVGGTLLIQLRRHLPRIAHKFYVNCTRTRQPGNTWPGQSHTCSPQTLPLPLPHS